MRTRQRRAPARVLSMAALLLAGAGCAHRQKVSTERRPDGIVHLTCKMALPDCLQEVENVCDHKRYVVLRALDGRDLKGVVPAQTLVFASEAFVRCGETTTWGPLNKTLIDTPLCPQPAASPTRACTPGATQACVGPAGCAGGQACAADGSRFGVCDCGQPSPPPPAAAPAP